MPDGQYGNPGRGAGDCRRVLRLLSRLEPDWDRPPLAPKPRPDSLVVAARVRSGRFEVPGPGGWEPFHLRGVNLGAALPGRFPAEFPTDSSLYSGWLDSMAAMGANVVRTYTIFPPAFPSDPLALLRVALKRAPEANYHLTFLPQVAPWLIAFRVASHPQRMLETARLMRPLFARAVAEHEALLAEAGAGRYLRKDGWLKLYRGDRAFEALAGERSLAQEFGIPHRALDTEAARALEPGLAPVIRPSLTAFEAWLEAAS